MLVPLVATWVPTVVGLALASGMLWVMIFIELGRPGPDVDGDDSDSEGGGWGRRRPRRPPPVGPVSWEDFERQFAAYVEDLGRMGSARDRARVRHGERAPNVPGNAHRGR